MPNLRKDNYFVRVSPDILIPGGSYKWKSKYSRWLYVCLLLDYNINIQNDWDREIKVNYKRFTKLFRTSKKTLHAVVNDLVANGLLKKTNKQNRFKLIADKEIICSEKSKKGFVPIYNNFFLALLNAKLSPRQLLVYYYLIYNNRYFKPENDFIRTKDTQSSIVTGIHSRSKEVKVAIEGLITLELLFRDEDAIIYLSGQKLDYYNEAMRNDNSDKYENDKDILSKEEFKKPKVITSNNSSAICEEDVHFDDMEECRREIKKCESDLNFNYSDYTEDEIQEKKEYLSKLNAELHRLWQDN